MFERFTERARQVVVLAQDEARLLKHDFIGTEHLLLGLIREEEGIAARALGALGVTLEAVRAEVAELVGTGDSPTTSGQIPFTPRGKKALELSLRATLELGHDSIGTEHLLLGLARVTDGVAMRILWDMGVGDENIRDVVIGLLGNELPSLPQERRGTPPPKLGYLSPSVRLRPVTRDRRPVLAAALWCALGLAAGVLVGWAIWG